MRSASLSLGSGSAKTQGLALLRLLPGALFLVSFSLWSGLSLLSLDASATENAPVLWRVHPSEWFEKDLDLRGKTWSEASRFLYGDTPRFGARLRRLNQGTRGVAIQQIRLKILKPQIRVARGDTLEKIGRRWVGNSTQAYRVILELNPSLPNPNSIQPGTWLTVPRIALMTAFGAQGGDPGQTVKPESPFLPKSPEETLALAKWYLSRLDASKELSRESPEFVRADRIAEILESESRSRPKENWEASYAVAQHFVRTSRPERALPALELALQNPESPIQVGVLYLKLRANAGRPLSEGEKKDLLKRFPGIAGLFEEDGGASE